MKVNLLIVCTGKYVQFLQALVKSADKFFLRGCEVTYCIFSDQTPDVETKRKYKVFKVEHKPFPFPTLHRFHFFKQHENKLPQCDHFFYVDVDALFVDFVSSDVLGERVAVQHCGYVGERGTYETRPESMAYVAPNEGLRYYGGGLWCFSSSEFRRLTNWARMAIDIDSKNGIVPVWHDESVLNRWLVDNPPTNVLSPSYHYPENNPHIYSKWAAKGVSYKPVALMLDKNHKEIRT